MRKTALAALPALAALALAGCSAHSAKPGNDVSAAPAAATSPAASPNAASRPLAFYASQYLADGKACMDAQDVLHKLPNGASVDQAQATATKMVAACQAGNAAMLRQEWPAKVMADIRAEVTSDGPVFGDLADLADNAGSVARDAGAANAAANLVRADLGLPPLS